MTNLTYKLAGDLTLDTIQSERDRLLSQIANYTAEDILLDLSQVKACDSSGIALLIEIKKICLKYNKKLKFFDIPDNVLSLVEFFGVNRIIINDNYK